VEIVIEEIKRNYNIEEIYADIGVVDSVIIPTNEYNISFILKLHDGTIIEDRVEVGIQTGPPTFEEAKNIIESKFFKTFTLTEGRMN